MAWYDFLLKIDFWGSVCYGFGGCLSFMLWATVAVVLLSNHLPTLNISVLMWCIFLGGLGNYYFSLRRYEKQLRGKS